MIKSLAASSMATGIQVIGRIAHFNKTQSEPGYHLRDARHAAPYTPSKGKLALTMYFRPSSRSYAATPNDDCPPFQY
jgi:hypothetical protein